MKRLAIFLFFLFASSVLYAQSDALPITACIKPGTQAKVSGLSSTNYQMGVIPFCTVTVYLTGTTTVATTTPQTPLTANFDGSIVPIFATDGQGYDVKLSGGVCPNCYSTPFTITDLKVGGGGGGCTPVGQIGTVQESNGSGGCQPANIVESIVLGAESPDADIVTIGQTVSITVTTWNCSIATEPIVERVCTFNVTNNFAPGQWIIIGDGFTPSCMSDAGSKLIVSATTTSFIILNTTLCDTGDSGTGGNVTNYYANLVVNTGAESNGDRNNNGINLMAISLGDVLNYPGNSGEIQIHADSFLDLTSNGQNGIWICTDPTRSSADCSSVASPISIYGGSGVHISGPNTDGAGDIILSSLGTQISGATVETSNIMNDGFLVSAVQESSATTTISLTATSLSQQGIDATSGAVTVNLPPISSVPNGLTFTIFKEDASVNHITIMSNGSDVIGLPVTGAQPSQDLCGQYDIISIIAVNSVSLGTKWWQELQLVQNCGF